MSQKMTEQRLIELLDGLYGAIVGVVPMTAHVIENAPSLKVISMHGVGFDHVEAVSAELLGGGRVAVVEGDDAWGQGQGVGAVGPLLALLRHRVGAAAGDELEVEAAVRRARSELRALVKRIRLDLEPARSEAMEAVRALREALGDSIWTTPLTMILRPDLNCFRRNFWLTPQWTT